MRIKDAIKKINYFASKAHSKHTVSNIGQMMVYQEKADEAADYIASNYPIDLSNYPLILAEVNATGKASKAVADSIIEQRSNWLRIASRIEEIRMRGNNLLHKNNSNIEAITEETIKLLKEI